IPNDGAVIVDDQLTLGFSVDCVHCKQQPQVSISYSFMWSNRRWYRSVRRSRCLDVDGTPLPPNNLSRHSVRFVKASELQAVSFQGLRHTPVSAPISRGAEALTISRRIGHATPVTLRVYAHMFQQTDTVAASAIEAALGRN